MFTILLGSVPEFPSSMQEHKVSNEAIGEDEPEKKDDLIMRISVAQAPLLAFSPQNEDDEHPAASPVDRVSPEEASAELVAVHVLDTSGKPANTVFFCSVISHLRFQVMAFPTR